MKPVSEIEVKAKHFEDLINELQGQKEEHARAGNWKVVTAIKEQLFLYQSKYNCLLWVLGISEKI